MNWTEIFTPTNIAKFLGLFCIFVLFQIAIQALVKRMVKMFGPESFKNEEEEKLTRKRQRSITLILSTVVGFLNFSFFIYLIYATILAQHTLIPKWFMMAIMKYGMVLVYAILAVVIYKIALKLITKGISLFILKASVTYEAKQRAALREKTLNQIISYLLLVILSFFFIYQSLTSLGINLTAIIASLGIVSFGIGFGAQNLVKDYINGFFIILEDRFAIGDVINANGIGGFVEKMTLRTTHLRNTHGILITIPNSDISTVQNLTKDWSRVDFTIGVDYATDVPKTLNIMWEELEKLKKDMPQDLLEPPDQKPDVLALDSFGDSSLNLRIWFKTKPIRQWSVQREYNVRLLDRFNKEGIVIPFPQSTLSMRDEVPGQLKNLVKK